MSRIIVLGASGMLGTYMYRYLRAEGLNVAGISRKNGLDALDVALKKSMHSIGDIIENNDTVINCVGILKPNVLRVGAANTILINTVFPQVVADICQDKQARFIHISSDCIFSGLTGNYVEDSVADADDLYAKTKSIEPKNAITLRTSFVGEDLNLSGVGLLEWVRKHRNKTIDGYSNCIWNGITCLQFAKIIKDVITNNIMLPEHCLRHIHSPQTISKYELCCMINDIYNLNITVNKQKADSISGSPVLRYLDRSLSTKYTGTFRVPKIKEQLTEQKVYDISKQL